MKKLMKIFFSFIGMALILTMPMQAQAGSYMEKETENFTNDDEYTAEEINCPSTVYGQLDYGTYYDDSDYFKFILPQDGKLKVKFAATSIGEEDESLTIYLHKKVSEAEDEYGDVVIDLSRQWSANTWSSKEGLESTMYLTGGEYYIQVYFNNAWRLESPRGDYSFDLSFEALEGMDIIDNNSWEEPFQLENGKEYKAMGTAINDGGSAYYMIDIDDPGVVNLNITSSAVEFRCYMYTVADNMMDTCFRTEYTSKDSDAERYSLSVPLYLEEGSYIISLDDAYSNALEGFDYQISYTYTPAERTYTGIHDTCEDARILSFDREIHGFVSHFREQFYYKITLPSTGILNLNVENNMQPDYPGGNHKQLVGIYKEVPDLDDYGNLVPITNESENVYLKKGTYTILFQQYEEYIGSFSFTPTFTSANTTFEDGDDFETANKIYVGDIITGQLSVNDKQDVYVFELNDTQDIAMNFSNDLSDYSTYALYDADKKYVSWIDFDAGECGEPYSGTWNIGTLEAGTYYLVKDNSFMNIASQAIGSYQFELVYGSNQPIVTDGVSLNKTSISILKGTTYALKATVTPSDAADQSVTWSSSNKSVATVTGNGLVKAIAAGKATITVTTKDTGKTDTCVVTVKPAVPKNFKLKKTSGNVKLSWTKISDVTGYKIYRSTKKNSGYKVVKTIKKPSTVTYSAKLSSLKKNTTYYYKIVAYKTVKINGKNTDIRSNYSSYASVKR